MSGALFLLTVNFFIAQLFCVFFLVIAKRSRIPAAGRWFAGAYAVASLSAVFEIVIRYGDIDRFAAFGAFSSVLVALLMIRIGIGCLYAVPVNVLAATCILGVSLTLGLVAVDLPRDTWTHAIGYQVPFAVVEMLSAVAVYRSGRREAADLTLICLLVLTALQFLGKAYFSVIFAGGPEAQTYMASTYALISQSLAAVLVVSTGLTLLAVIVVEIMDAAKARSEIDPLSGLYNRRGFNARVNQILSRPLSAFPHCVVIGDLDHFKTVNDTYGHSAGDQVILAFGDMVRLNAPADCICARLGGEEFAIFLPSASEATAYLFAQGLRNNFSALMFAGLPEELRLTASFGVCEMTGADDNISDVIDRADGALYDAKKAGRNRVNRARTPAIAVLAKA